MSGGAAVKGRAVAGERPAVREVQLVRERAVISGRTVTWGRCLPAIITAARQAVAQAAERAEADAAAGGCAHTQASPAYQVPARLREFVSVRDLTCRFPTCRQPAWRCDADHTRPFDQDGPTCSCNLGPSADTTTSSNSIPNGASSNLYQAVHLDHPHRPHL